MADQPHLPHFNLKIDGKQAPADVMNDMLDCTVENSLNLPDVCTLRMHDATFRWLDSETFREGNRLEVLGTTGQDGWKPLFDGEIVGLELDLSAHDTPTMTVRCFDRSHRLHRGRVQRSFQQVTDTDLVRKIAGELAFNVDAEETGEVYEWVFQNNQTNWEFLHDRAARNGFRLYVTGEQDLHFKRIKDEQTPPVKLEWGITLRSFRPRTAASPQVDEVLVKGWDPQTKSAIIGRAERPSGIPQINEGDPGGVVAKRAFSGTARMVLVDRPVQSQGEADNLARSVCNEIAGTFIEADGLTEGNPEILPGKMVEIRNIGNRFKGRYYVTSTTHVYAPKEGYSTLFAVNGTRSSTVLSLLEGEGMTRRAPLGGNLVIGVVTNNSDPEDQGRVKVRYPWLSDQDESYWVRIAAPMAGPDRGFYFLPEIDDEVLVAFEHGDIHRPYIIGALWNGRDDVIEGNSKAVNGGKVDRRTIKTRIGHTVLFDDSGGKGEMSMTTANGHVLTLDDENQNVTVTTTSGHTIVLDDSGGKIVVVDKTGTNSLTIKSGDNSISMECVGNFSVRAKGKVSIEGLAGMDLKTPAIMTLQGSLVKIN